MKNILLLLDPRSDETNSIVARGITGMFATVGGIKMSPKIIVEWVQYASVIITFLIGVATLLSICFSLYVKWRKWRKFGTVSSSSDSLLILLFLSMMALGCRGLISEQQQSESLKATEALFASHDLTIRRSTERDQGVVVTRDGQVVAVPIREQVEITSSTTADAGSKTNASGNSKTSQPLWVKIAGTGIGLILLAVGIKFLWSYIRRTALGQGLSLADSVLAEQIRRLRARVSTSTDSGELARLNAEIAQLEADRGRTLSRGRT